MPSEPPASARPQAEQAKEASARRWWSRRAGWWISIVAAIGLALIAANQTVDYVFAQVPLPDAVELPESARVYDVDGELIATYRDEVTRFMVDAATLPDRVREAVIAAEDRDFYEHEGLSLGGIVRAGWANLTSGQVEQGGSTITQQYVKNAVLDDPSRTVTRKIREAVLAIKLEQRYSKDEILQMYLNTVYFGRGAYGIEAAARTYFAKHADNLTLGEAAYLAGLIPAPSKYQIEGSRDAALARREYVLRAMREEGYISERRAERAARSKLRMRTERVLRRHKQDAAFFLEWLRKEYLSPRFGDCLFQCGLKIYTTIDMDMQRAAEEAVKTALPHRRDPEAALVSMTPRGRVRALVGSHARFKKVRKARGFNFATDARRQAGSAFKPFTLLAAIEDDISTRSRFPGRSPKTIDDPACTGPEGLWEPENYAGTSYGTLDLISATTNSVNTVYAELITEVGPEAVAELVEAFGFKGYDRRGAVEAVCSLALGTLDVSPLEMARAYATIAARGVRPRVMPIRRVEDADGNCLLGFGKKKKMDCETEIRARGRRIVDANSVDVLTQALTNVVEGGTATAAQIGRPAAGKTGTTQDNRDAWFAGYVPQLATVVWMGYPIERGRDKKFGTPDDISPLMRYCVDPKTCRPVHGIEVTGGSFPATIWGDYMAAVLSGVAIEEFVYPADQPDRVLNPPPPPPPPDKEKDKGKGKDKGKDDDKGNGGNGNEGNGKKDEEKQGDD